MKKAQARKTAKIAKRKGKKPKRPANAIKRKGKKPKQTVKAAKRKPKKPTRKAKTALGAKRKPTRKPTKSAAKKNSAPALRCDWDIQNFHAVYSQSTFDTTFSYTRTNPQDAVVELWYSSSVGGKPDNQVPDVANYDSGEADCSGQPHTPWAPPQLIGPGCNVRLELWLNGALKKSAPAVVQTGP